MQNNIVGKKVREARNLKKPKLTQKGLVEKLQLLGWDIDRGGIAKIESGFRKVSDIEVRLLSDALEVSIDWLFITSNSTSNSTLKSTSKKRG